ncbi:MAG: DUF72 domain-containing protein, partial [Candidatus Dadabacteria bacterium]
AEVFPAVGADFSFYTFPPPEQWAKLFHAAPRLCFGLKAPEMVEGATAFLEKRKPDFWGVD